LEISLDPRLELSEGRTSLAVDYDVRYILLSEDGRASSLAAVRLMEMGMWNVSDVVGGFEAWKADGLPFYN
jgi:rhodanese-related sulfurtransferase